MHPILESAASPGWEEKSKENISKRRMLRRWRSRSLHGAFRISISGALALNRALLPSASYPFVPFIPPSRGVSSPLRRSSWFLHPCSSRVRFALRLACSCANRGAMSRYFVGFILENIWWLACGQRELARSGNPLAGGKRVARARG